MRILKPEELDAELFRLLTHHATEWMSIAFVAAYYAAGGESERYQDAFRHPAMQDIRAMSASGVRLTPRLIGQAFAKYRAP